VVAPLDQLSQDPALLVGDRGVDLGHGDPARRGHAQPRVVDVEADGAPPRAAQLVLDGVRAELRDPASASGWRDARLVRRRHAGARRALGRDPGRQRGRRIEQRQRQLQRGVARRAHEFTESLHAGRLMEGSGRRAG
jgi:hypothetical protein